MFWFATGFTWKAHAAEYKSQDFEWDNDLLRRAIKALIWSDGIESSDYSETEEGDQVDRRTHRGIMDLLFGYDSVLTGEQYLDRATSDECNWIFSPKLIREKIKPFMDEKILNELEFAEEPRLDEVTRGRVSVHAGGNTGKY